MRGRRGEEGAGREDSAPGTQRSQQRRVEGVGGSSFLSPWNYLKKRKEDRFQRERRELNGYLEAAIPLALHVDGYYREWRESVEEPIQDGQKAANLSAIFWWHATDRLRAFGEIAPPNTAAQYHKLFAEALRNASEGAEIAKNGFRFNKFFEVSRGIAFLDRYLELMAEAEQELGQLLRKYRLIEEPVVPLVDLRAMGGEVDPRAQG